MNTPSTQMPLRIPSSLHKELKEAAKSEGVSLNQYCLYLLAKNVQPTRSLQRLKMEKLLSFLEEAQVFQKELKKSPQRKSLPPKQTPLERLKAIHEKN